jgi:hypothetical protein
LFQRFEQSIWFTLALLRSVMSKKISHVSDSNFVGRRDEPETAFGAATGFDKTRPRHELKNLRGLCRWKVCF